MENFMNTQPTTNEVLLDPSLKLRLAQWADLNGVAQLILDVCTSDGDPTVAATPSDLEREWKSEGFTLERDAWVVTTPEGRIVGYEEFVNQHWFSIRTLDDDKLLGDIDLYIYNWPGRDTFVGLGIGERDFWGKGYGTDVMKVILRYAFTEINMKRVTLTVFEYNPRAIRSYEKAGFRHEGRMRAVLNKEGKRWDMLTMGILREEWMEQNGYKTTN